MTKFLDGTIIEEQADNAIKLFIMYSRYGAYVGTFYSIYLVAYCLITTW